MIITLQDCIDNVNDNCQNFDVTSIDRGNVIRQINRGIEYMQRRLGLPSDKKTFAFDYYEDTRFYDCPEGFNEFLQLYYDESNPQVANYNRPINRWNNVKDTEINNWTSGYQLKNKVATTTVNGKTQLMLSGHNQNGSNTINSYETLDGLTFSTDISNEVIDRNNFVEGNGSLMFDMDNTLSRSSVIYTGNWNMQSDFNENAAFRVYANFPANSIEQIDQLELRFQSSTGNYYSMYSDVNTDGSNWIEDWNLVGFKFVDADTTGNPDSTAITQIQVIVHHSALFIGIQNFRLDYLYQVNPDHMICSYYSAFKGTDSTGTTPKINLDDPTDICYFGSYAADLIEPIALRATVKLFPQLRGTPEFWQMYKMEMDDALKTWGRIYPHQRGTSNFGTTEILR